MSWIGEEWPGPVSAELQALVRASARQSKGQPARPSRSDSTVPVHVRCVNGHDSGGRVRLTLAGDGLRLEPRGGEIFTAGDSSVAEELSELDPEAQPPLRVLCLACGAEGQGLAAYRLLDLTVEALVRWLDPNKGSGKFPRFVWPGA